MLYALASASSRAPRKPRRPCRLERGWFFGIVPFVKQPCGSILAIDGPAGSGKSTTARLCAERLGFRHLDTGAMYRAVTMKILGAKGSRIPGIEGSSEPKGIKGSRDRGIEWTEADGWRIGKSEAKSQTPKAKTEGTDVVEGTAEGRSQRADCRRQNGGGLNLGALERSLRATRVSVRWDERGMRTVLDGKDVSEEIRSPEVAGLVSEVSAIPAVRKKMVAEQRRVSAGHSIVCEGRDIGSVVFPDADLKIFLECDTEERARRRQLELSGRGAPASRRAVRDNLLKRDRIDSGREVSPLRRMPDAVLLDTTQLTIEEQVEVVCGLARRKAGLLKSKAKGQEPKAKAAEPGRSEVSR